MAESIRHRARRVFMEVADLAPEARAAALDGACAGDARLLAEVQALLDAEARAGDFMATPTADRVGNPATAAGAGDSHAATVLAAAPREQVGEQIGRYKLLEQIGEGGFGSVWAAEQREPVKRRVALKIIKLGMDTRQVIARFEAERQALAMMDHPNIAKVLDAGATETGRPFFVMELVKGDPIVEYCDKNNLSIEDRLELFAQVCNAVQHAHTKGIIHRDIKPSNILVSTQDGRPHTKVIDFGIAKATASKLTEKTLFTEHKALIGTPEYMSPEQAEGSMDIDTRTDVYSLGVMLYELLTGTTPFGSKELRSAAHAEIQRIIREVEPPKPSTRLSANTDTIASVAARRHTEPKRLGTIVRGELDWIVMKALEKDRQRRYETANGLAMDIRRYLAGEAVVAAPPSAAYRFRKFVRRNRGQVVAAGVVAAALVLGMAGTAWQAKRASDQRDLAIAAKEGETTQRKAAEAERDKAEKIAEFMSETLQGAGPSVARGRDITMLKEMMDGAAARIEKGDLKDAPEAELRLRATIGNTYRDLALYPEAVKMLEPAVALARSLYRSDHMEIAKALLNLAWLRGEREDYAGGVALARESLDMRRRLRTGDDSDVSRGMTTLAELLRYSRDYAAAESLDREALDLDRRLFPGDSARVAADLDNLGKVIMEARRSPEGTKLLAEALAMRRRLYKGDHPDLVVGIHNYAQALKDQGDVAGAEALLRESLDMVRRLFPGDHAHVANNLASLGNVLSWANRPADAEPLLRESLAMRRRLFPGDNMSVALTLEDLALVRVARGDMTEGERLFREGMEMSNGGQPLGWAGGVLLDAYLHRVNRPGDRALAVALVPQMVASARASMPEASPQLAGALAQMGSALLGLKAWDEAEPILRECLTTREKTQSDAWTTFNTRSLLGGALLGQNKLAEAEPLLLDGYRGMKEREAAIPPQGKIRIAEALERLVRLYEAKGNETEAAAWRSKLEAARSEDAEKTNSDAKKHGD